MTSDNRNEFNILFWAVKHDLEEPLEKQGTFSIYNEQMVMFVEKIEQLQSTIKAQEDIIKRLREAGENIRQEAVTQEPFSEPEGYSYITAWDDLMSELEKREG
jgi:hypothetical protein